MCCHPLPKSHPCTAGSAVSSCRSAAQTEPLLSYTGAGADSPSVHGICENAAERDKSAERPYLIEVRDTLLSSRREVLERDERLLWVSRLHRLSTQSQSVQRVAPDDVYNIPYPTSNFVQNAGLTGQNTKATRPTLKSVIKSMIFTILCVSA